MTPENQTNQIAIITFPENKHLRLLLTFRGSRQEVFCKKDVLKIFPKYTGKQLCQSLFFKNDTCLRSATLLKRDFGTDVFRWILRISRTPL